MNRRTVLGAVPASLVGAVGVSSGTRDSGTESNVGQTRSTGRERTGTVVGVDDADTVVVRFEDGTEETVRLQGVDAPESAASRQFETPEEWEGLAYRDDRSLLQLQFDSTSSLRAPEGGPLTDDEVVAVRSEPTARVEDTDGEGPTTDYGEDEAIPLVGVSGTVVGFGAIFVDGAANFEEDNEEFLLNVWDEFVGSGTVLWDEGHDQFFDTEEVSQFPEYAAEHGYAVQGTTSLVDDLPDADAVVVTSPSAPFSDEELSALSTFVDDGGAVFLHDQADYNDFDATENHNAIAEALELDFRFNDDQVFDEANNAGEPFVPATRNFTAGFESFLTDRPGIDGVPVRSSEDLLETAAAATEFARERLLDETVTVRFDGDEPARDSGDRLLGYLSYEFEGSERSFNRELLAEGYARVYDSGFAKHREFWLAEADARGNGRGVWGDSDVSSAPEYRNRPVTSLFFPAPTSVRSVDGELPRDRAPVRAMSTATQEGSPRVPYDVGVPLAGVDPEAGVAAVGAPIVHERYEAFEGYAVDTSGYENYAFLANLIDGLADGDGDVLVDGGHGQFAAGHAVSAEDAAYFQRFLEGQGVGLEQRNELTGETLADGRALVVSSPQSAFDGSEVEAVKAFRDAGGAVVLLGSAAGDGVGALNELAAALDSDLRFNDDAVVDDANRLSNDPAVFETRSFAAPYGGVFEASGGSVSLPERASRGRAPVEGSTSEPTSVPTRNAVESGGPLDDLLLPAGLAVGGVTAALAALGLWTRGGGPDEEVVGDARADGGSERGASGSGGDGGAADGGDRR